MSVDDPAHYPAHLATLLPHLASLLVEVPLESPVAVGIRVAREPAPRSSGVVIDLTTPGESLPQVEFLFRHLDCADIVCALCGFVAPPEWDVFGVITPGRSMRLDEPYDDRRDVTACALVDRAGRVVSEVRAADGTVVCSGPTVGRVADACRRVLGLATAPALCGPEIWFGLRWIDRVLAAVLDADLGAPPPWAALDSLDEHARACSPARARARATWRGLRTACALGEIEIPGIAPCAAQWMDDGMFGREAIAVFAPLVDTLGDLRELVPVSTFDKIVERVSERLGA